MRTKEEDSGQGLAFVLIVSAALLLLGTLLVQVLTQEMAFTVGTSKRTVMLHAADAAVDRTIYALQVGGNWDAIPDGLVSGYKQDITYTDVPEVLYTIRVQAGNWTPGVQAGDEDNERTVTVFVRNARTGERKKIQAVLMLSSLDSALYSEGQVYVLGSSDIHWGPIVCYSSASDSIDNPQNWEDHPIFLSVGGITLNNKGSAEDQGLNCADPIVGKCVCERCDALGSAPIIPVDTFRKIALQQDLSDPNHYYGPLDQMGSTFTCGQLESPDLPAVMDENSVVFFDSADAANYSAENDIVCKGSYDPISAPEERGANVKATDGCGKGTLVVLGDLFLSGNGSCPAITMSAPSDCVRLEADPLNCLDKLSDKLFWDGLVYVAGDLTSQGTQQIYGTVFTHSLTSDTKGNFSLYYKSDSQTLGYFGKSVLVRLWIERAPGYDDIFP